MRIRALFLFLILVFPLFSACRRASQDVFVIPPATHPLTRHYIGYGVVNVSFTHLMSEPGPGGVSRGHLRRGTVLRVLERQHITGQGGARSWVLVEPVSEFVGSGSPPEGNYQSPPVPPRGWLAEVTVEIFDRESRAITASRAMGP